MIRHSTLTTTSNSEAKSVRSGVLSGLTGLHPKFDWCRIVFMTYCWPLNPGPSTGNRTRGLANLVLCQLSCGGRFWERLPGLKDVLTLKIFLHHKNSPLSIRFVCNPISLERTPDRTDFASEFDVFVKVQWRIVYTDLCVIQLVKFDYSVPFWYTAKETWQMEFT